jgi:hypothetical protein
VKYELDFYIPEDGIFHSHRGENLISYITLTGWFLWLRSNVSPVKYELGFYIPEDGILHSHRRENLKYMHQPAQYHTPEDVASTFPLNGTSNYILTITAGNFGNCAAYSHCTASVGPDVLWLSLEEHARHAPNGRHGSAHSPNS